MPGANGGGYWTTKRDATHPVAPNGLNRQFTATKPNAKWVSDITSIPTITGWLYFAVILDLYSRAGVGWSLSSFCDEALAENALRMAVLVAGPKLDSCTTVIAGANIRAYRRQLECLGAVVSMSRKGNCWDNAAMESFFGSLKEECLGTQIYSSHEQAKQALFEYLEIYYNRQRRHSALGYKRPLVYEQMGKQYVENSI